MRELWHASLQFPVVVFTIALGIILLYWVSVLVGALDIDLLGSGHVDVDVDMSGAAKGLGELVQGHAGDAGGDAASGGDADVDGSSGGGLWQGLGLGQVPLTISVSVIVLLGWVGTLLVMNYALPATGFGWLRAILLPLMIIVALPLTALLIRPLAPIFRVNEGKFNNDYVGHVCTITTGRVDETFGYAEIVDGGSVLQIPVRCDQPGKLARGDRALIIEFDAAHRTYVVEPSADLLPAPSEPDELS